MTEPPLPPAACQTMSDVRAGVDAVDRALVDLLATRFGYMDAAARIKPRREEVRDEARKAQVLANVARLARAHGLAEDDLTALWDMLVERSIAHELRVWDARRT